ncbi:MAG: VWA domain-containing protein [Bacteroidales bacterium]|nr:VWA domain-containing protein [Bacteroidales bacterium]MDD4213634.1 VWA domain-containing protein [Bacteroidales bacterium]
MILSILNIYLAQPWLLLLLLIIPLLVFHYIYKYKNSTPELGYSSSEHIENIQPSLRQRLIHLPFILRMLLIALLIFILARPQTSLDKSDITVEGIDILISLDISGSMLAEDFKPNRLEASKEVAIQFIDGRPDDRMGLIIFSSEAFLQCPLTVDHTVLKSFFAQVKSGMITDGTAIGDGLGLSVFHIKKSKAVSKVIILLTDGINNTGSLDPLTAAEIAKKFGIRVYTIGVGTLGKAPYPFQTPFGIQYQNIDVQIDENLLTQVAEMTGGKYFRATNKKKLEDIYNEINKLEKSKIDVTRFQNKKDEYFIFVLIALCLLTLEITLRLTVFKKIP